MTCSLGVLNLFLYCFFSKLAAESFEKFAECLYECEWHGLPNDLLKYFMVMIANTQKPMFYHGFGVAILNLETFSKVRCYWWEKKLNSEQINIQLIESKLYFKQNIFVRKWNWVWLIFFCFRWLEPSFLITWCSRQSPSDTVVITSSWISDSILLASIVLALVYTIKWSIPIVDQLSVWLRFVYAVQMSSFNSLTGLHIC